MKYFRFTLAFFILSGLVLQSGYSSEGNPANDWKEVKNQDGIRIHAKKNLDFPIVMAKGFITVDASPDAIVRILDDNAGHTKWMPYLLESKKLEAIDDKERLEYNLFDAPWPASNRDFVFRVTAYPDERNGNILFIMKSEPNPLMPEQDGIVRGTLLESTFKLTKLEPGKTQIELLFQADPKGWIPLWIVNIVQRVWPYRILKGLREQVADP